MTMILQISDMHIADPGTEPDDLLHQADHLARTVLWINGLSARPDAVLCSGDLVDHFTPSQYARLADILDDLEMPFYLMVGNHDHRENLRAAFPEHGYLGVDGFVQYAIRIGDLRLVALDSQKTGQTPGELCDVRLDWLSSTLAEDQATPTVVALHHPPFSSTSTMMDAFGLHSGGPELAAILNASPQVERLVAGHVHRPVTTMFGGTVAMSCPSTSHQIALQPGRTDGVALMAEPPSALLHHWSADCGLISHVVPIGPFETLIDVKVEATYGE